MNQTWAATGSAIFTSVASRFELAPLSIGGYAMAVAVNAELLIVLFFYLNLVGWAGR